MRRFSTTVLLENRETAPHHFLATLAAWPDMPVPRPGQFFMVGIPGGGSDPLLKRPFSLHRIAPEGNPQILYRVRGRGTRVLSDAHVGTEISVLGPLGKPFPSPGEREPVIVGGGLGIVPLVGLAESLRHDAPRIFIGAKTAAELLGTGEKILRDIDPLIDVATDDGSLGRCGCATDTLAGYFDSLSHPSEHVVYACGPKRMLHAVAEVCRRFGVKGYLSMEENMACGVGACLGCVTPTTTGYRRVCLEGPVFPIDELVLG